MPKFPVPNTEATVRIDIDGLAACCFNSAFTDPGPPARRGRWEVALPHVADHQLSIEIPDLGVVLDLLPDGVKKIEIKDRTGVEVSNPKNIVGGTFDRKIRPTEDTKYDYRWLVDFTDRTETPHVMPTMVPDSDVTMLYVYDSTFYTDMSDVVNQMTLADHEDTGLIIGNRVVPAPEHHAGPALDRSPNFGFAAPKIIIDVHHLGITPQLVDIFFDDNLQMTVSRGDEPQLIHFINREPDRDPLEGGVIKTVRNEYGRGDFFRYYTLFNVPDGSARFHLWERINRTQPMDAERAVEGDCNAVRVDAYPNLDGLL